MKFIKDLNESFQLIPKKIVNTGNEKFFGKKADKSYVDTVKDLIGKIALEEHSHISNPQLLEKVESETINQMLKEEQQLDAIIHNCSNGNFRPQYAAEVAYHAIVQGRLQALAERPGHAGGLMESEDIVMEWEELNETEETRSKNEIIKAFFGSKKADIEDLTNFEVLPDGGVEFDVQVSGVFMEGEANSYVFKSLLKVFPLREFKYDVTEKKNLNFHVKITSIKSIKRQ
jgi:uncharacterized cupin superfamily protein